MRPSRTSRIVALAVAACLACGCGRDEAPPAPAIPVAVDRRAERRAPPSRGGRAAAPSADAARAPGTEEPEADALRDGAESARETGTVGFSGPLSPLEDRRARRGTDLMRRPAALAADRAADWIALRQLADGGWTRRGAATTGPADGDAPDAATTGLALLAILSTGRTHQTGDQKECVKSGLRRLRTTQLEDGAFDATSFPGHVVPALAMVEAYGVTCSVIFKDAAQRGVNYIRAKQLDDGSWADAADATSGDRAATAAAVTVLAVAHLCELEVDRTAFPKALEWFGDAVPDAATILARVLATAIADPEAIRNDATLRLACDRLLDELRSDDLEGRLLGALAAFQLGGETWRRWDEAIGRDDLAMQRQGETFGGSWDPSDGRDDEDTRFRETALRCMTLGARYRWPRIVRDP
ncbi:MAG: hypothetical protein K8T90_15385 [Planctomycetes bacterium]|nr:hypothetical protein [Planctomycetota bacterium]